MDDLKDNSDTKDDASDKDKDKSETSDLNDESTSDDASETIDDSNLFDDVDFDDVDLGNNDAKDHGGADDSDSSVMEPFDPDEVPIDPPGEMSGIGEPDLIGESGIGEPDYIDTTDSADVTPEPMVSDEGDGLSPWYPYGSLEEYYEKEFEKDDIEYENLPTPSHFARDGERGVVEGDDRSRGVEDDNDLLKGSGDDVLFDDVDFKDEFSEVNLSRTPDEMSEIDESDFIGANEIGEADFIDTIDPERTPEKMNGIGEPDFIGVNEVGEADFIGVNGIGEPYIIGENGIGEPDFIDATDPERAPAEMNGIGEPDIIGQNGIGNAEEVVVSETGEIEFTEVPNPENYTSGIAVTEEESLGTMLYDEEDPPPFWDPYSNPEEYYEKEFEKDDIEYENLPTPSHFARDEEREIVEDDNDDLFAGLDPVPSGNGAGAGSQDIDGDPFADLGPVPSGKAPENPDSGNFFKDPDIIAHLEKKEHDEVVEHFARMNETLDLIELAQEGGERGELAFNELIFDHYWGEDNFGDIQRNLYFGEYDSALEPFADYAWENMARKEQEESIKDLAIYLSDVIGLENIPEIKFTQNPLAKNWGYHDKEKNKIVINIHKIRKDSDPARKAVETIAHELWHAYQRECANSPFPSSKDLTYKLNFDKYILPEENMELYYSQLVEREARSFATKLETRMRIIREG